MSLLEVNDVSFSFQGGKRVLQNVSFSIQSGERVCLKAPSGFGKTTLCRIIAGYLNPSSGEVLLDGVALTNASRKQKRFEQGKPYPVQMIWQHPEQALDPRLRIMDSLEEAGEIDEALLSLVGIKKEWLSRYPRELSGGEMQRCCIARALRKTPAFLVADEISTMLDAITQVQIWESLLEYCDSHKVGLLMTSHSEALVERVATRTIDLTAF